jgi:translocation and assembly module TamB
VAPGLELDGRLDAARLAGSLVLESGQIIIPELVQKRPIDLSDPELLQQLDTTLLDTHRYLPSGPNRFVQGLQLQGVRLIIGDQVWLRSSEANIKLGGEVAVTKDPAPQNQRARLALEGTLSAARGTYNLDLGLVQRTFEVDTGRVVFYGDAELNPVLDISALHTVRQYNKQDVRIRVHIGGTLEQPVLTLSSAEGLPISQPVLLSYLVSGQPSLDVGSPITAASVLLPTAGSLLGNLITEQSGGLIDYVQVQTAGVQGRQFGDLRLTGANSLFAGTSLAVGKQLSNRTFVSATAGLCKILTNETETSSLFNDIVGIKVEHRFNHGFSVELGSEPASSALLCSDAVRGVVNRPRQLGFDLFRAWSF